MKLALLGTGLMGVPMGHRLLQAGHELHVYNRTADKTAPLVAAGALGHAAPHEAIAAADAVITMLADAKALNAVLLDEASRAALAGRSVIQMGTIAPAESVALGEAVTAAGGVYLESPVLGSLPEAREGRLLLMVGGDEAAFERWRELLGAFGPEPLHVGPVGQAAALKLAMNQLIAGLTATFSLSLGLVRREGVPVETFMGLLRKSALYAPTFDKKLDLMLERRFTNPNFPLKHLLKDVRLFLQAAAPHHLGADALAGVQAVLERGAEGGLAEDDYSALYQMVDPPA